MKLFILPFVAILVVFSVFLFYPSIQLSSGLEDDLDIPIDCVAFNDEPLDPEFSVSTDSTVHDCALWSFSMINYLTLGGDLGTIYSKLKQCAIDAGIYVPSIGGINGKDTPKLLACKRQVVQELYGLTEQFVRRSDPWFRGGGTGTPLNPVACPPYIVSQPVVLRLLNYNPAGGVNGLGHEVSCTILTCANGFANTFHCIDRGFGPAGSDSLEYDITVDISGVISGQNPVTDPSLIGYSVQGVTGIQ